MTAKKAPQPSRSSSPEKIGEEEFEDSDGDTDIVPDSQESNESLTSPSSSSSRKSSQGAKRLTPGKRRKLSGVDPVDLKFCEFMDKRMSNDENKRANDPDEMFCLNLAQSLKEMSGKKKEWAKLKLQSVLFDIKYNSAVQSKSVPSKYFKTNSIGCDDDEIDAQHLTAHRELGFDDL